MRAIELHLSDRIFRVTEEKIYPVKIQGLALKNGVVNVTFDGYTSPVNPDETFCKNRYETPYYFSLEDAQTAQMYARKEAVNRAFEAMQKANTEYNELIYKWFDKPASNPDDEN